VAYDTCYNSFALMFLKRIFKTIKATGEEKNSYRLVESYRFNDTVRHETILHLGIPEELPHVEQKSALAIRIDELVKQSHTGEQNLFKTTDPMVEKSAQKYFTQIKEKECLEIAAGKDYHRIDTDTVKNKDIREAGTEWLCMQALEQLNISSFLKMKGWTEEQIQLVLIHIISRAAYPASELRNQPMDQTKLIRLRAYRLSCGKDNQGQTLYYQQPVVSGKRRSGKTFKHTRQ